MAISWLALIILPILLFALIGLAVGLVMLLVNRKTRPWTLGFLALATVGGLLLAGLFTSVRVAEERQTEASLLQAEAFQSQLRAQAEAQQVRLRSMQADAARPGVIVEETYPQFASSPSEFAMPPAMARTQRMDASMLLLMMPIVALIGLGVLATVVYLLLNPKTRRAVLGVGGALAALLVVMAVFVFYMRASAFHTDYARPATLTPIEIEPASPPQPPEVLPPKAIVEAHPASDAKVVTAEMPSDQPEPKSLLRAVGTALGRALAAAKAEAGRQAMKEMTQVAEAPGADSEPPADCPAWIDKEPDRNARGDYEMPIYVGPYATRSECQSALAGRLESAVGEYAAMAVGPQAKGRVHLPLAYVQQNVVKDQWEEWKQYEPPLGEMVKMHVLLSFDREASARIEDAWKQVVVDRRLRVLGAAAGVLLALLATAWGYLRLDLATDGRKRGRLRLGAAAVATAVMAAGALLLA